MTRPRSRLTLRSDSGRRVFRQASVCEKKDRPAHGRDGAPRSGLITEAGDEHQQLDSVPLTYLDEQGRYRHEQRPPDPPAAGDELATLLGFLERQRATFAWKCGGLDAAGLRATVGASSLTLAGMLKHLARFEDDMSAEWLHGRAQRPPWNTVDWTADQDWDWRSAADDTPEQLYALWRDAVARSRNLFAEALAHGDPECPGGGISDTRGALPSLRYILINMIEESARHNGHADLIREAVDGLVGHDPPR
jgi:hypothetical protein